MRYLFVHAHPDDETLSTGAIISCLRAIGDEVSVLTATRGEMGEAVPGTVAPGEDLATVRLAERARALAALGADDAGFLGTPPNRTPDKQGRIYRDSGMEWVTPTWAGPSADAGADSLCRADIGEVIADIVSSSIRYGAEVLVSYDADGGYGHPDHVRCHDATMAAAELLGVPFRRIVADPTAADEWFDVTGPDRADVLAAHRAYRTQFTVTGERIVHVGGQEDEIRFHAGLA